MALLKHRRLADAEVDLRAVREAAAARVDPDRVSLAFVEQQLAWLALVRRRPAVARQHLDAAEAALKATGSDPLALANVESLRARLALLNHDGEAARAHHARAGQILGDAVPIDHPRRQELDITLADLELGLGRQPEALALATAAAERLAAAGPRLALLHAQARERQAVALHELGRDDEAVAAADTSLQLLRAGVGEDNPRIALVLALLAAAEAGRGRTEPALEHLRRADAIYAASSDPDLPERAWLRFEHARLLAPSRPAEASAQATGALDVLRRAGDGFREQAATVERWLASAEK
jgi:serine/threonine-protein kinase